ncbi:DNA-binding transcriptional regulator CytR [Serratia microhaemolytica]|uniref:DNA-binding transcriptional regulator CytR n=1 Tax=Serratia microhaemolytica TaxID=2675110 RepID=UPI000FDF56FB|nr:DNA-binding transcriptional regulator CytR [Serratia microhaemolytica]
MEQRKASLTATMKDVAEMAGVSTATVSRALMKPDKVSRLTRQKVDRAMLAVGYSRNASLGNNRRYHSHTLLAIVSDLCDPGIADLIAGVEQIASQHGYLLLVSQLSKRLGQQSFINLIITKQIDGILLLSGGLPFALSEEERRSLPPMVLANQLLPELELPAVHIDNLTAAFEAVSYLHSLGHRQIACLTGDERLLLSQYRLQGYLQALRRHDIHVESRYILRGDFSYEAGARAISALMTQAKPPTALFCHSDVMAIGALSQAKKLGLRIPQDLSIVGFDDIEQARHCDPPLTTVAQPRFQIGQQAVKLLLEQLNGLPVYSGSRLLESELIIRGSTAVAKR